MLDSLLSAPPSAEVPILPFERLRARAIALGTILLFLVALAVCAAIAPAVLEDRNSVALGYLAYGIGLAWVLRLCHVHGVSLGRLAGPFPRRGDWALLWLVVPLMACSFAAIWLMYYPLSFVAPDFVNDVVLSDNNLLMPGGAARNLASAVMIVAVAPVVEELVFRGLLFQRWAHKWGKWRGLWFSAAAFGVLHLDAIGAVIFGAAMALLYVRTGGLWVPIAVHMLNNAIALTGATAESVGGTASADAANPLAEFRAEWWVGVVALAVAIPLLWAAWRRWGPAPGWAPPYERAATGD
jgi:membrane protease YdiL (CAAX protease family)